MSGLRVLAWLIALVAFIVPPVGAVAMTHGAPAAHDAGLSDCPDHAPPPVDCPSQGTAKHAAGQCCPVMAGAVALLPAGMAPPATAPVEGLPAPLVRSLVGLTLTQDPPPPRT